MKYDLDELVEIVRKSGLFDEKYYLRRYREVRVSENSPLEHYCKIGIHEDFKPNAYFDPAWYREYYQDIGEKDIFPFIHYILFGREEGRRPSAYGASSASQADLLFPHEMEGEQKADGRAKMPHSIAIRSFDIEAYIEANEDIANELKGRNHQERREYIVEHLYYGGLEDIEKGKRAFHPNYEPYNEEEYLKRYRDIADAVEAGLFVSGFSHFVEHGYEEIVFGGREWMFANFEVDYNASKIQDNDFPDCL